MGWTSWYRRTVYRHSEELLIRTMKRYEYQLKHQHSKLWDECAAELRNATRERLLWETTATLGANLILRKLPTHATKLIPQSSFTFMSLLRFVTSPRNYEALGGDLDERYKLQLAFHGRRLANRWLRRQVLRSLGPLLRAELRRVFGINRLMELLQRHRS